MTLVYQATNLISNSGNAINLASGDTLVVAPGVQVVETGLGNAVQGAVSGFNNFNIYGTVFGGNQGINADSASIFVASGATVSGMLGAIVLNSGGAITNNGQIQSTNAAAIDISGNGGSTILNNGLITGSQAIIGGTGSLHLTNGVNGVIQNSVVLESTSGVVDIHNAGLIDGTINGGFSMTAPGQLFNTGIVTDDVSFGSGDDYVANDGTVQGSINLGQGNNIYVGKGSADFVTSGTGNDSITGGSADDNLQSATGTDVLKGNGGDDYLQAQGVGVKMLGGDGDDTMYRGGGFGATDRIDGGNGEDQLQLAGDYSAGVNLGNKTLTNVESILVGGPGASYKLTMADGNVAAGHTMTIDGSLLGANDILTVNAAKETDGTYNMLGGQGADVLTGGAGNDTLDGGAGGGKDKLTGGGGADLLTGGNGKDILVYNQTVGDSTGVKFDTVVGFDTLQDKFSFGGSVTGVDAAVGSGALSLASFDSDLGNAMNGHLNAHHAELFNVTAGDQAGQTFLIVDANGVAGYQAGQDYVIDMQGTANVGSLSLTDFS